MLTKANKDNYFIQYIVTATASLIILLSVLYSHDFHLSRLINYGQDNISHAALVKTFIENGFTFKNPMLGAPLIYNLSDYPCSDGATILILKTLSLFSHNFVVVMNLFFIFTFPVTVLLSLYVYRSLGLNKPFAFAASMLFAFIPFRFFRMEEGHLFLETIYVIPIYTYLIFQLLRTTDLSFNTFTKSNLKFILLYFLACIFAASSGTYYAYFACFFILLVGILASIDKRRWLYLLRSFALISVIFATIIVNGLPYFLNKSEHGPNYAVWNRSAAESEIYGLKISQLLLPTDNHQVHLLASFKNLYNATAPLINENRTATLGIIGGIGFIFLLFILFYRPKIQNNEEVLFYLSRLVIASLLVAVVGGFSSIFAYLGISEIRAYNRISVFIAFFSLAAFFIILQTILKTHSTPSRYKISWIIAFLIVGLGMVDQIPKMTFSMGKNDFEGDAQFVSAIEALLPPSSMIMQLPFVEFPESPGVLGITSYDHLRPYLFSNNLHWSFGAMKGRPASLWQQKVSVLPIKTMINELIYAGFTGLFINKNGYTDNGLSIEKEVKELLKTVPSVTNNRKDWLFYDLRPYAKQLQQTMSLTEWNTHFKDVQNSLNKLGNLSINWGPGLYQFEQSNNTSWHWSESKSRLDISVPYHMIKAKISFKVKSGYSDYANLKIKGDVLTENIRMNLEGALVEKEITLTPGIHHIYFKTDSKPVTAPSDWRNLYFAIYDFVLTTV